MSVSLILTQLPGKLASSPLYRGHYGSAEDGLEALRAIIEKAYSYMSSLNILEKEIHLRHLLRTGKLASLGELNYQDPFIQLTLDAYSSDDPIESILWLLKLSQTLKPIVRKIDTTKLCFITDIDQTGAYFATPITLRERLTGRDYLISKDDHRLEELRSYILKKMRRDI